MIMKAILKRNCIGVPGAITLNSPDGRSEPLGLTYTCPRGSTGFVRFNDEHQWNGQWDHAIGVTGTITSPGGWTGTLADGEWVEVAEAVTLAPDAEA